ncbi:pilus assembly protein, partial [Escherichia coli]
SHTLPSDRKAGPAAPQALHPAFPAGVSLPGVFARADRRPPPPALYHLCLLP